MHLKTTKTLSVQKLIIVSFVIVLVAIYANVQTVFHDPNYSISMFYLTYAVKNIFNVTNSVLIIILTFKLIRMHFRINIFNYQKFIIGKNKILKVFLILAMTTPMFTYDLIDYTVLFNKLMSEQAFWGVYSFRIIILSLSLISIIVSAFVIKKVTGEKMLLERELAIKHIFIIIESENENFDLLILSSKFKIQNFENKIKEFIVNTNRKRITYLNSYDSELLTVHKKGTCPPAFFS